MNSRRGLMFWGLSLAVTLAAPGQRRISAAETAKSVAPAAATTSATAKASSATQPAAPAAPTKPVVQQPPRPADPSVVLPTPLTTVAAPAPATHAPDTGAARDKGAAAADIMPLAGAGDGTAAPAAPAAAEGMPREPSIYETGRVGKMGVTDSGSKIKHSQVGAGGNREELPVKDRPSSPTRAGASAPTGHIDPSVLAHELRPRFLLLKDCRVQVARHKHLAAKDVPVGPLTLRWTILRTGQVGETEVVALSPVDGRVIDCMKRQMSLWSFTPPTGGPAAVERAFKFE